MTNTQLRFSRLGESAILLDAASNILADDVQRRIWELARSVGQWPEIREVVPGMNNLLVVFDAMQSDPAELEACLRQAWGTSLPEAKAGRVIEIPVDYGGKAGIDLAFVAERSGLAVEDVVQMHAEADYLVYALGAQPGFGYLAGLDDRIATPRREVPRTRVEAGSVVIGGAQAGVIACTSPSGWHVLGKTEVGLFDPDRSRPVLLEPGDRVRFRIQSFEK